MNLSPSLQSHVLREFDNVIEVLRSGASLDEKLYYFSALYGAVYRVMNIEPSAELIFLHFVLNSVHTAFQARLQAIKRDAERPVMIENTMMERLIQLTQELQVKIRDGLDSTDVCKQLIVLAYATGGNGYYLFKKGDLSL